MGKEQVSSRLPRVLTEAELDKLQKAEPANEFKKKKLEVEVRKNWDRFYKRNKCNFFKDRHWSREDILSLCPHINLKDQLTYLEAGCGVGNMLFPLTDYFPSWHFFGFDFSTNAIQLLNERAQSTGASISACVADLCDSEHFPPPMLRSSWFSNEKMDGISSLAYGQKPLVSCEHVNAFSREVVSDSDNTNFSNVDRIHPTTPHHHTSNQLDSVNPQVDTSISATVISPSLGLHGLTYATQRNSSNASCGMCIRFDGADLTTLVFVLSAIHPEKHVNAVRNLSKVVKKGGTVIVRDYGVNDHAMIRFGRGAKLDERFYARQDGTYAFYFQLDELEQLFLNEGYGVKRSEYLLQKTVNYEKNLSVDRVFVQAVFIRLR